MAANDIADLLLKIDATTEGLRRELKKADSAVAGYDSKTGKMLANLDKKFQQFNVSAGRAIGNLAKSMGAAGLAAAAGLGAIVKNTADTAREITNLSHVANTSTTDFQRWSAGAQTVGIEQGKLADILKDMSDRVGDFLSTGGGPMADFFENIAPQVGVTAEQFRKLSGPDALQLYVSSLEKANLTQNEMAFYMEAVASDATALIPLLRDNGAEMNRLGDRAEDLGAVLSDMEIEQFKELRDDLDELGFVFNGLGRKVAVEALPHIRELMALLKDPETVQGIQNIADALVTFASKTISAATATANLARFIGESLAAAIHGPAFGDLPRLNDELDELIKRREDMLKVKKLSWINPAYDEELANLEKEIEKTKTLIKLSEESLIQQNKSNEETQKSVDLLEELLVPAGLLRQEMPDIFSESADEAEDLNKELQRVLDKLYPQQKAVRDLVAEYELLAKSAPEAINDWIDANLMIETTIRESSIPAVQELAAESEPFGQIWETTLERLQGAFADIFYDILDQGKITFDSILDLFKRMVAEMAAQEVMIRFGIGGQQSGGLGNLFSGTGGGGFNLGNIASIGGTAWKGISGLASGEGFSGFAGMGGQIGNLFGMGGADSLLINAGTRSAGGAIANTGAGAMNAGAGASAGWGGIAASAGWAALIVGIYNTIDDLLNDRYTIADAITGNHVNMKYADKLGGLGDILLPSSDYTDPLGITNALLGGIGGDGKKRSALGLYTTPNATGSHQGDKLIAESGLELTAYAKRAGDNAMEVANSMVEAFGMIDSVLTGIATGYGVDVDLSGQSLAGKMSEAGKSGGGTFFGSVGFNGDLSKEEIENAAEEFINAWLDAVEAEAGREIPISKLVRNFKGTSDELVKVIGTLSETFALLDVDAVGSAISDFNLAQDITQTSAMATYNEQTRALRDLISTYDGSLSATQNLNAALAENQTMAYQLAIAYQQVSNAVSGLFGNLAENIRQSLMSQEELYEYQRTQVHTLTDMLNTMTDPEQILQTAQRIEQLTSSMWSGLEESQRQELGGGFLDYLEKVDAVAQERLQSGIDNLQATQGDLNESIRASIDAAGQRMAEAANQQAQAVADFGAYVQQFGYYMDGMRLSTEVG